MRAKYDVVFLPHKGSYPKSYVRIAYHLRRREVSAAFLKPGKQGGHANSPDFPEGGEIAWLELENFTSLERSPEVVVTIMDRDQSVMPLINHCKVMGVSIVGLQDDLAGPVFENVANSAGSNMEHKPFTESDVLLLASDLSVSLFPSPTKEIIGIDAMETLLRKEISFPDKPRAVLHLSAPGEDLADSSRKWLEAVASACDNIGLDFVISVGPDDKTDTSGYGSKVSKETLSALMEKSSVFISRTSDNVYEALALGKPAVCFTPYVDNLTKFIAPEGAFSVAHNDAELKVALRYELPQRNIRDRAKQYFRSHFGMISDETPAERAAEAISRIVLDRDFPAPQEYRESTPSISVIVPVYNVSPYLDRCIDSLLNQTLEDIEIIVVNDASTDNTLDIAREYRDLDPRINILDLGVNSGLSRARNIGMLKARGSSIMFVDGDDWLHPEACRKAFSTLAREESDVVLFDYYDYRHPRSIPAKYLDFEEVANSNFRRGDLLEKCSSCTKIYNADFLKHINAHFPEATIFEDWFWTIQWVTQARKIYAVNDPLYFYRRNRIGSLSSIHRSEVDSMRGIIQNIAMSKQYLDARGKGYETLATLINKSDNRIRGDNRSEKQEERRACYKILQSFLVRAFRSGLPKDVVQESIIDLYASGT